MSTINRTQRFQIGFVLSFLFTNFIVFSRTEPTISILISLGVGVISAFYTPRRITIRKKKLKIHNLKLGTEIIRPLIEKEHALEIIETTDGIQLIDHGVN